jgi:hypothetical protein
MNPHVEAQLAREVATADLFHAARQYATVAASVPHGDVSQELLRDREATLLGAARRVFRFVPLPRRQYPAIGGAASATRRCFGML